MTMKQWKRLVNSPERMYWVKQLAHPKALNVEQFKNDEGRGRWFVDAYTLKGNWTDKQLFSRVLETKPEALKVANSYMRRH